MSEKNYKMFRKTRADKEDIEKYKLLSSDKKNEVRRYIENYNKCINPSLKYVLDEVNG